MAILGLFNAQGMTAKADVSLEVEGQVLLDRAVQLANEWRPETDSVRVFGPDVLTFTADEKSGLPNETVQSIAWNVSDDAGTYSVIVLLYEQPVISTFFVDSDGRIVGKGWKLSESSADASVVEEYGGSPLDAESNDLACAVATGAAGGAAGSLACLPFSGPGAIACGIIGGAGSGVVGYFTCQDPTTTESVKIDTYGCSYTYCSLEVTVRSWTKIDSASLTVFWDTKGQAQWGVGAMPCRPACGDSSITQHTFYKRLVRTIYVPDTKDPTKNNPLYEYYLSVVAIGAPSCFVDNTVATWSNIVVKRTTSGALYGEGGLSKPSRYCDY